LRTDSFPEEIQAVQNGFHAALCMGKWANALPVRCRRVAGYGGREMCREPLVAGLTPAPEGTARAGVSIGKKTVDRAPRVPV
jgi:hypothetical protein